MLYETLKAFGIKGEENGRLYFAEVYPKKKVDAVIKELLDVIKSLRPDDPSGVHPEYKIDKSSKKTQTEAIKDYLLQGHSITPLDALEMFGCFRLGARIADLKKQGYKVDSKIKKDERTGKRYALYKLEQ